MTRLDDVSRIDEVLGNTLAFDKAGLVVMDKEGDKRLKARSQSFRDDLWGGILKGDRAEIASSGGDFFFWQKNYIGFVKLMQVCSVGVEIGSEREETGIDQVPKMLKEGRAEAGPGLALEFMARRDNLISEEVKGRKMVSAWKESRELER